MAPDKIYLPEEPDVFFQVEYDKDMYPVEYIRKDTLLEWANRLKEKWEEPPMSRYSPGCSFMLGQVIKKIESL